MDRKLKQLVYERDGGRCVYCGDLIQGTNLGVDHVVARAKGGSDTIDNVVCCCERCNSRKSILSLSQFLWNTRFERGNLNWKFYAVPMPEDESPQRDWLLVHSPRYTSLLARRAGK
jgi:hypothetical protein